MSAATVEVRVTLLGPCQLPGGARGRRPSCWACSHCHHIVLMAPQTFTPDEQNRELRSVRLLRGACQGHLAHTGALVLTSEQLGAQVSSFESN